MQKEIEDLREKLNKELEDEELTYQEILKISQELDELIIKFYKEDSNNLYK